MDGFFLVYFCTTFCYKKSAVLFHTDFPFQPERRHLVSIFNRSSMYETSGFRIVLHELLSHLFLAYIVQRLNERVFQMM